MAIPTLDHSHFILGTKEQREKFPHALLDSFERTDLRSLMAHTFSAQELKKLLTWVGPHLDIFGKYHDTDFLCHCQRLFDQPLEVKNNIPNETEPRPMRGYTPWRVEQVGKLYHHVKTRRMTDSKVRTDDILREVLDILTNHDTKEHFDQGPDYDTDFPNKCPKAPEPSGFRPVMEDFYRQCDDVCLTLMKALEVRLGYRGWVVSRTLRTQRNRSSTNSLSGNSRQRDAIGPYCTIYRFWFHHAAVPRQHWWPRSRRRTNPETHSFVPLPPTDTTEMIVNVGDTLTRCTNGKITGGIHQVTAPEAMKGKAA